VRIALKQHNERAARRGTGTRTEEEKRREISPQPLLLLKGLCPKTQPRVDFTTCSIPKLKLRNLQLECRGFTARNAEDSSPCGSATASE